MTSRSEPRHDPSWHALRYILSAAWLRPGQYREAVEFGEKAAANEHRRIKKGERPNR